MAIICLFTIAFVASHLTVLPVPAPLAQDPEPRPAFDVASVKENASGDPGMGLDIQPGGRLVVTNLPLKQLIRAAYMVQLYQISNAPRWVDVARFDVAARTDRDLAVGTPWSPDGPFALVQLMLQSLLAERFGLAAHHEIHDAQGYALVVRTRSEASRLRVAEPCGDACGMKVGPGSLVARDVPLPQLAELLSQLTGRIVVDASGLPGRFDFDLTWAPDAAAPPEAPVAPASQAPSIFTAVQEQLGLRLEPRRVPIRMLVIDAIERPTPD